MIIGKTLSNNPQIKKTLLCNIAGVSRSSFYSFTKSQSVRHKNDSKDLRIIKKYFDRSREKAGILTLDMNMRSDGIVMNHKKIARIKKEYHLITKIRRRNPYRNIPLKSGEHHEVPNLLQRNFYHPLPDTVYSTDMTYLYYGKCEKAYLSATKDLASNEIVSFNLMKSPTIGSFTEEFRKLLSRLPIEERDELMIHSDQGYQYTHPEFIGLLREFGVKQSMSRRGNCLDNAPIESFFGHLKDLLDLKKCKSFGEVGVEVNKTIKFYNYSRPQRGLNKMPPVEYRGLLLSGFL